MRKQVLRDIRLAHRAGQAARGELPVEATCLKPALDALGAEEVPTRKHAEELVVLEPLEADAALLRQRVRIRKEPSIGVRAAAPARTIRTLCRRRISAFGSISTGRRAAPLLACVALLPQLAVSDQREHRERRHDHLCILLKCLVRRLNDHSTTSKTISSAPQHQSSQI